MARRASAALLLALAAAGSLGAATPPREPVRVEADRAELDERRGVAVYTGAVRLRQGRLEARGERLTVHTDAEGRLTRAVVTGDPATCRRAPASPGGHPVECRARRLEYLPQREALVLTGAAVLRQGPNVFRSEHIAYDLAREVVRAEPKAHGGGRVRVTIEPRRGEDGEAR